MFDGINLTALAPTLEPLVISGLENTIGITPGQALAFLQESESENAGQTMSFYVSDATGKFKHMLRTDKGWGGAVDVAWDYIAPFAGTVVSAVASQAPGVIVAQTAAANG